MLIKLNGLPYGYPEGIPPEVLAKAKEVCGNLPYEVCNAKILILKLAGENPTDYTVAKSVLRLWLDLF